MTASASPSSAPFAMARPAAPGIGSANTLVREPTFASAMRDRTSRRTGAADQ